MSTPEATLYVCSGVRLNPRYEHSIYFASREEQEAYFARKVAHTFRALSYLRKTWPVQVHATMEQAKTWSYLYFHNGSGKTYYYFITQVEYKNEHMVELTLELDVLQTYHFDYTMLRCFVERQHTLTDVPGEHTVDEALELGELIDEDTQDMVGLNNLCIMILATINPNYHDTGKPVQALSGMYDKVFSGLKVWAVPGDRWQEWGQKLEQLNDAGFPDGIISMWMYPQNLVKLAGENTWEDEVLCKVVHENTANDVGIVLDGVGTTLDGYEPKNKKLLAFPYKLLYVTNNTGESASYRYERFASNKPNFRTFACVSPDGIIRICPIGYNGVPFDSTDISGVNYEQGISLGGFPSCAWDSDVYKLWLAQNQNQHAYANTVNTIKAVGGAMATAGGLMTGNLAIAGAGAGALISGMTSHQSHLAQKKDMEIQPPQSRGTHSSNVNISAGKGTFTFIRKSITAEYARMLDDYFTMYGYKLARVDVPHRNARPAFTYLKTVGCKIAGDLCTDDIIKIEAIYDKGITFWRDGDKVADYSQDNAPQEV